MEKDFKVESVRIDQHHFEPTANVVLTLQEIKIIAPSKQNSNESIVLVIPKDDVTEISCYLTDDMCALIIWVTTDGIESLLNVLEVEEPGSTLGENNEVILHLSSMIDVALKAFQSVFSDKIVDLDEAEYIDVMDQFFEINSPSILIYPPPEKANRGIQINRKDYKCLSMGNPINDVIVDFYLKYLYDEKLVKAQQKKSYIFSQYFYTRLKTSTEHAQVARWTKNVNLFEKDFIIVPINVDNIWILAIICFPTSGRDISETPCILFFDSLVTDPWDEVADMLRNYLTSEYRSKFGANLKFNRQNMPHYIVDVPQQDNAYDGGLYLLQYVESFFKKPIKDFRSLTVLNGQLTNWFEKNDIRMKREDISNLITELVHQYNPKKLPLPIIDLSLVNRQYLTQSNAIPVETVDISDDEESPSDDQVDSEIVSLDDDDDDVEEIEDEDDEEIEDEDDGEMDVDPAMT